MPIISVTEKDLSWYLRQREQGIATVYIPGIATFGPEGEAVLCDSSNFANIFGTSAVKLEGEISYNMAASIIQAGFDVLFHRTPLSGAAKATYTVSSEESTEQIKFTAKYTGTFGNAISLQIRSLGTKNETISAYVVIDGTVVETLVIDLVDPTSANYYKNLESGYIAVEEVLGDVTKISLGTPSTPLIVTLAGGLDYGAEATAKSVREEIWNTLKTPGYFEDLKDPYQFDYDVVLGSNWQLYGQSPNVYGDNSDGAWSFNDLDKVDEALLKLVKARGTSILLVDGKSDWDDSEMYTYCSLFDTSFAAGYGPWGYAQLLNTGDTTLLPGSYAMVTQWAQSCSSGVPTWMAPAGVKRSAFTFYKNTVYPVGKVTLDMWQNHDYIRPGQYCVNPIMRAKQYGYIIYGNSTLLKTRPDGATSMLQSFSVRVLANLIKVKAFDVSLSLQFDQLTGDLFTQFKSLMAVMMDQLRFKGALYDYEIVLAHGVLTKADLNEKRVPVIIRISPNPTAENFDITLEITQSGVSFSDESGDSES